MTSILVAFTPSGDSLMARYVEPILFTLLFAFVGLVVFAVAFAIMAKVAPSSGR